MAGSHQNSIEGPTRVPLQAECEVRKVAEFSEELAESPPPHADSCWESIVYTFILKHVICKTVIKPSLCVAFCSYRDLWHTLSHLR